MKSDSVRRARILQKALSEGLLHPENAPLVAFLDWDRLEQNVTRLHQAFPSHLDTLHAFAVKANPLVPVLSQLAGFGLGAEVASEGELNAALSAGITPSRLVFDSRCV